MQNTDNLQALWNPKHWHPWHSDCWYALYSWCPIQLKRNMVDTFQQRFQECLSNFTSSALWDLCYATNIWSVYNGILRSLLKYCSPLFVGLHVKETKRLVRLQSRFHRILCGSRCTCQILPSLEQRRHQVALKLFCNITSGDHVISDILPDQSSLERSILPFRRTDGRSRSFILYMCSFYNSLHKRWL